VNGQHFRTFLWLRWRLRINQLKRAGTLNAVILLILAVGAVLLAIVLFVAFYLVGLFVLPRASPQVLPQVLLYVWDGLIVAFLFFWCGGVLTDLQRSESLALGKFLHLPVSLTGAFLINYFSSLVSLNLIVFVPAMVGLALGLICGQGPAMLVLLPLLAAFLLMVTAITYQFQGWLAALMVNKRRRRTVIVVVTAVFVLLCQVPNLVNLVRPWHRMPDLDVMALRNREVAELQRGLAAGKMTVPEFQQRLAELQRVHQAQGQERDRQTWQEVERTARILNACLPPGWLPLGAANAAEGQFLPAVLGTLGLALLGTASLWRSYRTTVRLYTGHFSGGKRRPAAVAVRAAKPATAVSLVERQLPWLTEQASAIALAGFRSLTRAPEAKMMLMTPFILVLVFGSILLTKRMDPPELVRPLMTFGAMLMVLLSMAQIIANQFGFDRSGFRVFVLCPARRRDILIGKNLALAPLALSLAMVMAVLLQVLYPVRIDYFLTVLPQFIAMYLLTCMLANWLSILAPMPIAPGSLRPTNAKVVPVLLQMVFVFLFPVALTPTLLPLGVEALLTWLGWAQGIPIGLALSVAECVGIVYLYDLVVGLQGNVFHAREQRILEIVASKAE
jgi:hypothetical protein